MTINPNDPDTCYVVPLEPMEYAFRATPGTFRVYRAEKGGRSWRALGRGLPDRNAYLGVLREGVASDTLRPCGVYIGTSCGHVFHSADEGENWKTLAEYLPPILSVSAAVV